MRARLERDDEYEQIRSVDEAALEDYANDWAQLGGAAQIGIQYMLQLAVDGPYPVGQERYGGD